MLNSNKIITSSLTTGYGKDLLYDDGVTFFYEG
jgi:hypothetical protein